MTSDTSQPAGSRRGRYAALLAFAVMVVAGGAYAARNYESLVKLLGTTEAASERKKAAAPVPVKVEAARQRDEPVIVNGLGIVQAWNTITVRSRVDGAIEKIGFEEGQLVKEGDVLFELDARPFIAARDQAKAKIEQDNALLTSAKADLARTTSLQKDGYATRQLFDQQTAAVKQLQSQIVADEAALENAETQLAYAVIRAPISGRVGLRSVDVGNLVRASDAGGLLTITQVQPIAVIFTAPEQYLTQINASRKNGPLTVTASSTDGKTLLSEGVLDVVDNAVDTNSGSIRLKGRFDNHDGTLWPGQSVTTRLTIAKLRDAVVISESAVQRGPSGLYIFVVKPDRTAELRPIEVAQIQDGWAVVRKGLSAGEQVVTSGQYKVQPGSPLEFESNGTKAANAAPPAEGTQ